MKTGFWSRLVAYFDVFGIEASHSLRKRPVYRTDEDAFAADAEALAGDWRAVMGDLERARKRVLEGEEKSP